MYSKYHFSMLTALSGFHVNTVVPPLSVHQLSERSIIRTVEVTVLLEYFNSINII